MGNKLVRARQYPWGVVQGECGRAERISSWGTQLSPLSCLLPVAPDRALSVTPCCLSCLRSLLLSSALSSCAHPGASLTPGCPLLAVENENHCDFVKLREMLIRVNMEDLREQTHSRHYELYRRCKLEEMGFQDSDGDSQPFR